MRGYREARGAWRLGLLSFSLAIALSACGPKNPQEVAAAADTTGHVGIYTWLAEHDPSGITIVGLDSATVHIVAPDARILSGSASEGECSRALREHTLLAAISQTGTPARARFEDCGYALYHDDGSIVVAPR